MPPKSGDGSAVSLLRLFWGRDTARLEVDLVKNNWEFTEVWIDPNLSPPYLLLLLSDTEGNCRIYDPAESYKVVFSSQSYDEAQYWLLEDEYEPVEGRLSVSELV